MPQLLIIGAQDRIGAMKTPPANLSWFADTFKQAAKQILQAWEDVGLDSPAEQPTVDVLCGAMDQLIDLLRKSEESGPDRLSGDPGAQPPDISEMGDYGLNILEELALMAEDLGIEDQSMAWELLAIALARWIAYHGGELSSISALVNGLAFLANNTEETDALEEIYTVMGDFINATSPATQQQPGDEYDQNPWHLLLLNRGIIATRIMSPRLMDAAYSEIAQLIPEDAGSFFREGMEQMELVDYPPEVREVIERYFNDWPGKRVLH